MRITKVVYQIQAVMKLNILLLSKESALHDAFLVVWNHYLVAVYDYYCLRQ